MVHSVSASVSRSASSMVVDARARTFRMALDEPASAGGTDTAMTPVEALLGALGGCLSLVAGYKARKMGIPFDSVRIEMEGDMDMASSYKGFQEIRVAMFFRSSASQEDLEKLARESERGCPVSSTLRGSARVVISRVVRE